MPSPPVTFLLVLAAVLVAVTLWRLTPLLRGRHRRQQAQARLLDAADALEARLREARAEIEAVAVAGAGEAAVRDAMQEMLRQRLWLQQHGDRAPVAEIDAVRQSIEAARARIDQQLLAIERARAPGT